MDRKRQQADLIYKLGLLLSPLEDVADHPTQHTAESRSRASARFHADLPAFRNEVQQFTTESEPGHVYEREWIALHQAFERLKLNLRECVDHSELLRAILTRASEAIRDHILAVPVSVDSRILEAHTPFSTYCTLKDLCQTVAQKLIWVDRYLDDTYFYRYLRDVSIDAQVSIVTLSKKRSDAGLMDASRLYSHERGHGKYRFLVNSASAFHDRWICCDDQIYHLGPSAKDAAHKAPATLSKVDPTQENFSKITKLLNSSTEVYGPMHPKHP